MVVRDHGKLVVEIGVEVKRGIFLDGSVKTNTLLAVFGRGCVCVLLEKKYKNCVSKGLATVSPPVARQRLYRCCEPEKPMSRIYLVLPTKERDRILALGNRGLQMKGYLSTPGVSPTGEGQVTFFLSQKQLDDCKFRGDSEKFFEAHSVAGVLKNPTAIFEDLKRERFENGLCYIGKPRVFGDGWDGPTPAGMVFSVYATRDFKIFEWGWERADSNAPDVPRDSSIRFGKQIWKR